MRVHITQISVSSTNTILHFDNDGDKKYTCRVTNTDAVGWYESEGKGAW